MDSCQVKKALMDKTGTLTKQGLDYVSTQSAASWNEDPTRNVGGEMTLGMAVCHSLTVTADGRVIGNPVDMTMFNASGGTMDVSDASVITDRNSTRVRVVRHFDFDFHRMTQSVIVRRDNGSLVAFVKGSSEAVSHICDSNSLPEDFDSVVEKSAKEGIYQISMASKEIASTADVAKIKRDEIESELSFCGCINFKNLIRENTATVVQQLAEGEVDSIMVTGDSVVTGICIAKEAGIIRPNAKVLVGTVKKEKVMWTTESGQMVDLPAVGSSELRGCQLAVSGRAWTSMLLNSPELASNVMDQIRVYGRCSPRDKVVVVSEYVKAGHVTLMVGDGGNDCGALKMAHVGVALSDAEASIVAPFTSLDKDIASVVSVIREGRCSLASALASYKFMIMCKLCTCTMRSQDAPGHSRMPTDFPIRDVYRRAD
jgi:cation-transporting ATPase 13A3/4/5